ncbi:unnamed protein product [Caenorhabditis sp. 36 PRJEB53466]|nr:unnamed protein product [Caenorhabditis sp. 36 PRJEB53466]
MVIAVEGKCRKLAVQTVKLPNEHMQTATTIRTITRTEKPLRLEEVAEKTREEHPREEEADEVVAEEGEPPAKRGRKKKAAQSDSEDETSNFDSDHLHEELKKCLGILVEFSKDEHESFTFPFRKPVDTAGLGLTDYHEIIKKPMDMSTIKKKLIGEEYETAVEFKDDFKLMINNCLKYNNKGDPVSELAIKFLKAFEEKWKKEFPEDDDVFGVDQDDEGEGGDDEEVEIKKEEKEEDKVEDEKPEEEDKPKEECAASSAGTTADRSESHERSESPATPPDSPVEDAEEKEFSNGASGPGEVASSADSTSDGTHS